MNSLRRIYDRKQRYPNPTERCIYYLSYAFSVVERGLGYLRLLIGTCTGIIFMFNDVAIPIENLIANAQAFGGFFLLSGYVLAI